MPDVYVVEGGGETTEGYFSGERSHAAWEAPQLRRTGGWEDTQCVLVLLLSPPHIPCWLYQRWCSGLGGSVLLLGTVSDWMAVGEELCRGIWLCLASSAK